jgi:hypothetical protein
MFRDNLSALVGSQIILSQNFGMELLLYTPKKSQKSADPDVHRGGSLQSRKDDDDDVKTTNAFDLSAAVAKTPSCHLYSLQHKKRNQKTPLFFFFFLQF